MACAVGQRRPDSADYSGSVDPGKNAVDDDGRRACIHGNSEAVLPIWGSDDGISG